ncbi:MarR family winged helix-turn-helix transcriptional regulator [Staphylococcus argensis]|nr:MarR family transcriptional regulator [Staphylococcus argensis]
MMERVSGIDEWMESTEYFHYIEQMIERNFKQQYGLSLREFCVLYNLYKQPEKRCKINDLIQSVRLSQSAMSRLVNRLERGETPYVCRNECAQDQRATIICLTDKGIEVAERMMQQYRKLLDKVDFNNIDMLLTATKASLGKE